MIDKRLIKESKQSMNFIYKNIACQVIGLLANIILVILIAHLLYIVAVLNIFFINSQIVIMIIGLLAIRFFMNKLSLRYSHLSSENIKYQLRRKLYNKLVEIGPSYSELVSTSEVMQVMGEGVDQLDIYFAKYIPQLFYSLLAPLILFLVILPISFKISFVLFICVPLIPISIVLVQKIAKKILSKYWNDYTGLGDNFLENIQGLTQLKVFGSDKAYNEEMNVEAERFRKSTMRVLIMQLNSISIMDMVAYGGSAAGIILTIIAFQNNEINFISAVVIILLAAEFFLPMRLLGSYFHIAMNGMAASSKIYKILALETDTSAKVQLDDQIEKIIFDNVSFKYSDIDTLSDVSITFEKGLTAIVGESGSGKSTIANIITMKRTDYKGTIKINDEELSELDSRHMLNQTTLVSLDSFVFKGDVRSNLVLGNSIASDQQLLNALDKVNLLSFFESLNGLDTKIESEGANLSGGQKQRLVLARALLADSKVYIFDEATSNIDTMSEQIINDQIATLAQDKIVIVISHRLANVINANKIIMLEKGKVAEQADHNSLVNNNGKYNKMYQTQRRLEAIRGSENAA